MGWALVLRRSSVRLDSSVVGGSHQPGQVAHVHSVSLGFRGPLRAYARWCFVHRENLYAATDSVSRMVNVRGKNNLCDIMHEAEFSTNGSRQTCPHM